MRALSCEFEGRRYRRRAAFLMRGSSRRSMGRIPISWWSGSVSVVLEALEMCRMAAFWALLAVCPGGLLGPKTRAGLHRLVSGG